MNRIVFAIGLFLNCSLLAQVNDESIRLKTLEKSQIGKTIIYGKWNENGGNETQLTYLGTLSENGVEYKILNSSWIWGMSKRATNRILIYTIENQYIGNYYVTEKCDLPSTIENNKLIFERGICDSCEDKETIIEFENGIPEQIFIDCKGKYGDIYVFTNR